MIKCNVGGTDIIARSILGLVLLFVAWAGHLSTLWQITALTVAVITLITAALRYCPIYAFFGLNSCTTRIDHKQPHST